MKIPGEEEGEVQATLIFPWPHRSSTLSRRFILTSPSIFYAMQV